MKKTLIVSAIIVLLLSTIFALSARLRTVKADRDIQRKNVETLFSSVETYKVQDSLQAATIGDLQLTVSQYKQFRAEDAQLIESLKVDNKRLQGVVTTQTEAYYKHTAILRDSVKRLETRTTNNGRDTIKVPIIVKAANFEDKWHTLKIEIDGDSLNYILRTRESLVITNHIVPKRFLWFRFGCKEVRTDVVSKNPYVEEISLESITIK